MSVRAVLDALGRWVPELLPEADRAGRIVAACRAADVDLDAPITLDACRQIELAAQVHSRHLALFFDVSGSLTPSARDEGWPPPDPAEIVARAGSVSAVTRSPGGW